MVIAESALHQLDPFIIAIVGASVYYFFNKRGHTGDALDFVEKANDVLTKENRVLKEQCINKDAEIATLKASRDVTIAIKPVLEEIRVLRETQVHQQEQIMGILTLIANNIGPENIITDAS